MGFWSSTSTVSSSLPMLEIRACTAHAHVERKLLAEIFSHIVIDISVFPRTCMYKGVVGRLGQTVRLNPE
jgi:hypothetical protein